MDKIEPVAWDWKCIGGLLDGEWLAAASKKDAERRKEKTGCEVRALYAESAVSALLSENARYKEALERISTLTPCEFASPSEDAAAAVRFARAALSAQEDA